MIIVALPLLTLVTVSVTPLAASTGDIVLGDTVTIPVLLDVIFTLDDKFEIRTSKVLVPVHVNALVTVVPISTSGVEAGAWAAPVIVNVSCVE